MPQNPGNVFVVVVYCDIIMLDLKNKLQHQDLFQHQDQTDLMEQKALLSGNPPKRIFHLQMELQAIECRCINIH